MLSGRLRQVLQPEESNRAIDPGSRWCCYCRKSRHVEIPHHCGPRCEAHQADPSRGFSTEIGAAIISSCIGLPVSTTHCQVGATMWVGLVELKKGSVIWKQFGFICAGWVFTVVFTGFLSAGIFALLINSPLEYSRNQPGAPKHWPGQNMLIFDSEAKGFRGAGCSGTLA